MGGHGGLNILPQKRWNVYRYDNREKVKRDEEEAAKEEQLKREQSRKRDGEFRLERLRTARGLVPLIEGEEPQNVNQSGVPQNVTQAEEPEKFSSRSNHINLFEGIKIFDPVKVSQKGSDDGKEGPKKKMKKEESGPRVILPEDEKYRLGYGVAGKGVKLPWYVQKPDDKMNADVGYDDEERVGRVKEDRKKNGKKTLEELREERLNREKLEKERERALLMDKGRLSRPKRREFRDRYYSR